MVKISIFNKINDVLIVDAVKNVFQRESSEVLLADLLIEVRDNPKVSAASLK